MWSKKRVEIVKNM